MPAPQELVDALESTVDATAEICAGLTAEEWARPTGCPGWSVQDNVAHLAGLECVLSGHPEVDHDLVGKFPHAHGPVGEYMERQVDARRGRTGAEVLAELVDVFAKRVAYLRGLPDDEFDAPAVGPLGSDTTLRRMLPVRVFDCWAHEQDIRRAVGRPGGFDGAAAAVALGVCKRNAPHVVAGALPDDATVVFELDGPHGGVVAAAVADGKATVLDVAPEQPTVKVATDTATFAFLCCGRAGDPPGRVATEGDNALATAVLARLGFTP